MVKISFEGEGKRIKKKERIASVEEEEEESKQGEWETKPVAVRHILIEKKDEWPGEVARPQICSGFGRART